MFITWLLIGDGGHKAAKLVQCETSVYVWRETTCFNFCKGDTTGYFSGHVRTISSCGCGDKTRHFRKTSERFHWCLWWPFYARPCCFPNPYLVFPCFQTQPEHEHSVVAGEKFKIEPKETLSSNLSVVLCLYLFKRLGFGRVKARKLLSLKKIRLNRVLFPTRQTLVGVIINFLTNWTFIKQIRH